MIELTDQTLESKEKDAKWYVIHTYSGHENKVKANMESLVKNRNMDNLIFDIQVPMEEYISMRNGKEVVKERKVFPSYVLVKMIMNDESWYLVRNTRGVTGFVGPGSKPVPLTDEEVLSLGVADKKDYSGLYEVGDIVEVIDGPFKDFMATINQVDEDRGKLTVVISMFGRDTNMELDFRQVKKN